MNGDRGSRGLLPIGLVAIAAVIYSLVPGGGGAPETAVRPALPPAPVKESAGAEAAAENEALRPLCEYLDMVGQSTPAAPCEVREGAERTCPPDDLHPVRFLIAMVPDPIDSHLAQSFDRAVDAIQNGMQDSGFILDRFYLPWKREGEARWNISRLLPNAPEGFLSVNAKTTPSALHRSMPGTLLFRATNRGGPDVGEELVVVFLIGETPTSGVQRVALNRALEAIRRCPEKRLPCLKSCQSSEIRIVGPYFSGSTDSLHHLLWAWNQPYKGEIEIVSGSATVDRNALELRSNGDAPLVGDIHFHATVVPDLALSATFNQFLRSELHVEPTSKVALFVEGGTSYGSGYKDIASGQAKKTADINQRITRPGARRVESLEARKAIPQAPEPTEQEKYFRFVVSFPLHVSQLRGAYEKSGSLRSTAPARNAPRNSLELALDAPEGATRDILPTQDPQMAANIADLVLASSLETIHREDIRFVGIAASDPRDILFLARRIRENAATVTLFTFGADTLYVHPDYERYLRGMFVVTPYPLFPANQSWTGSRESRRVRLAFPGATEEGIYNAVKYQLHPSNPQKPPELIEYQAPFVPEKPEQDGRPPIWITAVGRHGFWPVDILSNYEDQYGYVLPSGDRRQKAGDGKSDFNLEYRPPGGLLTFLLLEGLFLGVTALYVALRRKAVPIREGDTSKRSTLVRGFFHRAETVLSVWSQPGAREINRAYVLTLLVLMLLIQITAVIYIGEAAAYIAKGVLLVGCAILVLLAIASTIGWEISLFVSAWRRSRAETLAGLRQGAVPAIFVTAISIFLVIYWIGILRMPSGRRLSFYVRTFDLSSSISPLLPILMTFTALCLWALSNIQRAYLLEIEGNVHLVTQGDPAAIVGLPELESAIHRLLEDPGTRAVALLAPALALVPFYRLVTKPFDAMDGWQLSFLVKFLLLSCYFVIVYSFALFFVLWLRVRRLLQRLSWHPIAEAFRRLPESVAASPWRMWRAVPNLTGLEASVSLLQALVNLGKGSLEEDYWTALKTDGDEARRLLDRAVLEASRSFSSSLPTQRELRLLLSRVMFRLMTALEEVWRRWPGEADSQHELRKAGEKEQFLGVPDWLRRDIPGGSALWIRTAEEFIALRLSSYTHYVFLHMKSLLTFVFLGFLLVIGAINSYPFEPKQPVMALLWVVAIASVVLVAWSFLGMNRDRILSYIGKTAPGEVTLSFEFLSSMAIYVVVPILTLLATQFPGIGEVVFSVFSPTMKSLR